MPQPISSSLMSRYVLNAEDSQCFHHSKMKKCEVDLKKGGCSSKTGKQEQSRDFATIAKISQSIFAILAKFSLCENFARLAKFR